MRRRKTGEVVMGNMRIWTIVYADDVVMIADKKEELREMLRRFKKWLQKKKVWR